MKKKGNETLGWLIPNGIVEQREKYKTVGWTIPNEIVEQREKYETSGWPCHTLTRRSYTQQLLRVLEWVPRFLKHLRNESLFEKWKTKPKGHMIPRFSNTRKSIEIRQSFVYKYNLNPLLENKIYKHKNHKSCHGISSHQIKIW